MKDFEIWWANQENEYGHIKSPGCKFALKAWNFQDAKINKLNVRINTGEAIARKEAQDKIKELEAELVDERSRVMRFSVEIAEIEKKLAGAEKMKDFSFKKRVELEGLLKVAVVALNAIKEHGRTDRGHLSIALANEALSKIKSEGL